MEKSIFVYPGFFKCLLHAAKEHFFGSIAFIIGFPRMLPAKTLLLGFNNITQLLYLLPQLPQLLELCYLLGGSLLECTYFMMGM